jgi:hypothetical protein
MGAHGREWRPRGKDARLRFRRAQRSVVHKLFYFGPVVYAVAHDRGPTKTFIVEHKDDAHVRAFYQLAYAKRPAEELYDLTRDPQQLNNVGGSAKYRAVKKRLNADLEDGCGR